MVYRFTRTLTNPVFLQNNSPETTPILQTATFRLPINQRDLTLKGSGNTKGGDDEEIC